MLSMMMFKRYESILRIFFRSQSSRTKQYRYISPQLRFHMDTKAVYGSQRAVRGERPMTPSELDLLQQNPYKNLFDKDTELLFAGSDGFRRACSVAKGIPISERRKYLRDLFRIPRGQPISLFPQAYTPNRCLGERKRKNK